MKIIVAGDFCDKFRVTELIKKQEYETLFGDVRSIINSADYSIVNFEFPIVANEGKPILKCGPNLKGQPESVDAIKYAGFNCCTLANNHILDQGEECLLDTKNRIEAAGIRTVGAGANLAEASEILYLEKDGQKLAVINCCEHEFTIATDTTAGANPLNPLQQYYKIQEARKNADYVLVIVHGGHEHYQLPSPRMKETYRFFVDAGADAVVNHHQHCYSGYEVYKKKPIFYGIGNFLFDRKGKSNTIWNEGYMVEIDFSKGNLEFELHPYNQCNEEVKVVPINVSEQIVFVNNIQRMNDIIANDKKLTEEHRKWMDDRRKSLMLLFEPYSARISKSLYQRGYLPSLVSLNKFYKIANYLNCEAHLDCIRYVINNTKNRLQS